MRAEDMRKREEFDVILRKTLNSAWATMGYPNTRIVERGQGGSLWRTHTLLGGFFSERPSAKVRHFLRDGFRGTPVRKRVIPQWFLGTGLSTTMGLRITSSAAFGMQSPPPHARHLLILPGNQRIRVFDFLHGRVRTILKDGFSSRTMRTEVLVRGTAQGEPFTLPIETHDLDGINTLPWFEEEIFSGYALVRCPPWLPQATLANSAMRQLSSWSELRARPVRCDDYLEGVIAQCQEYAGQVGARFGEHHVAAIPEAIRIVKTAAMAIDELFVGPTHGDFQPGNILVNRRGTTIKIIDWEHAAERSTLYDKLVFGLHTRSAHGLAGRWALFINNAAPQPTLQSLPHSPKWRRSAAALVALEDLAWFLRESLSGPFTAPSAGLPLLLKAIGCGVLGT